MSLAILSIHFLYRYIAIVHSKWLVHFSSWYSFPLCVIYVLALALIWSLSTISTMYPTPLLYDMMRDSVMVDYDAIVEELGCIGPVYYYTDSNGTFHMGWEGSAGIAIIVFGVLGFTWALIIFCGVRIQQTLKHAAMSQKVRELQTQLFRALIVQTIIPSITNYLPAFVTLATPIFGIDIGKLNNYYSPVMVCLFPVLDPLCIIYFVKDYKKAVQKAFGCGQKGVEDSSTATGKYITPSRHSLEHS
ncbi:hypothetical protein WR25_02723 isoform B [Diploscapter pachys]|uniref:G-protein coupled receptors family 1 profile domain-containing protein n=1 Tax=Diploscapter pachys TaxID=2018661 RepID=A0A2A2JQS8_9BILA|nr:hypothetical protein WR25_02723 isoform A [Diploscapter pachys]PAV63971.1 hypothetical protein WR25_02723 isoform B [Diploscapter pachys]